MLFRFPVIVPAVVDSSFSLHKRGVVDEWLAVASTHCNVTARLCLRQTWSCHHVEVELWTVVIGVVINHQCMV